MEIINDSFAEIHRLSLEGSNDYGRILAASNAVLSALVTLNNNNKELEKSKSDQILLDAFHCRLTSLIHQSKHKEALDSFTTNPQLGEKEAALVSEAFAFEKSYCLYRLHQLDEALQVLSTASGELQKTPKLKQLRAQILYRKELFQECINEYTTLFTQFKELKDTEHLANYLAATAGLVTNNGAATVNDSNLPSLSTFELYYNSACIDIARNQLSSAIEKLKTAEELCEQTLKEEGYEEKEILSEVAVIRVQRAVSLHLSGKIEEALFIYNTIIKEKPSDIAVMAVASNNVVAINKDRNAFDSQKLIKAVSAEGIEKKLNSFQRKAFAINQCLLLLHMNQSDKCRSLIEALQQEYPDHDALVLVSASLLVKENKLTTALALLETYASKHSPAIEVNFTLAQNQLSSGNVEKAIESLKSIKSLQHRLGMVATLVSLYEGINDIESASKTLNEALQWWTTKSGSPSAPSQQTLVLLRHAAKFQLRHKRFAEAKTLLEQLVKFNRSDLQAVAELTLATSHLDSEEAEQYAANLTPLKDNTTGPLDVDALENISSKISYRAKEKLDATASASSAKTKSLDKKKKKKKKKKLPKNYDPNVTPDPERWLPKRERSFFKKGKKIKRDLGKTAQGASATASHESGLGSTGSAMIDGRTVAPLAPSAASTASTSISTSTSTATPAPETKKTQPPQRNHNKKKKK